MDLLHLIDTAPDAVIVLDRQGHIVYWNYGATDTFGYSEDEMMNQPMDKLLSEKSQKQQADILNDLFDDGDSVYAPGHVFSIDAKHKNGDPLRINYRLSFQRDETHNIQFLAAILRDVTQEYSTEHDQIKKIKQLEDQLEMFDDKAI